MNETNPYKWRTKSSTVNAKMGKSILRKQKKLVISNVTPNCNGQIILGHLNFVDFTLFNYKRLAYFEGGKWNKIEKKRISVSIDSSVYRWNSTWLVATIVNANVIFTLGLSPFRLVARLLESKISFVCPNMCQMLHRLNQFFHEIWLSVMFLGA